MTKGAKDPQAALASHAGSRDTLVFSETIKHPGLPDFRKGEVVKFTDPAAAAYFDIAFNGTEFTDKKPDRIIDGDELDFDPETEAAGVATIDPATVIGVGRENLTPGLTVLQVASGETTPKTSEPTLEVKDVIATTEG